VRYKTSSNGPIQRKPPPYAGWRPLSIWFSIFITSLPYEYCVTCRKQSEHLVYRNLLRSSLKPGNPLHNQTKQAVKQLQIKLIILKAVSCLPKCRHREALSLAQQAKPQTRVSYKWKNFCITRKCWCFGSNRLCAQNNVISVWETL
jgi:hypothetical protein